MDQDSFRRLLQTPRPGGSSTTLGLGAAKGSRGSLLVNVSKPKTIESSQTAFKPRKLKKQADGKYRDRAAERRVGEGNDYAHVEAIYEEFEKKTAGSQNKEEVEVQRRYLGGDGEHSILVKGLDLSLLEQNKARAALSTNDDDALEEAFMEATSHTPMNVPKKRTREELLRDLKEQRTRDAEQGPKIADEGRSLEEAKQKGRFKPIGFKPIGSTSEGKKKREKDSADGVEGKNKKRKVGIETSANKAGSKYNSLMAPPPVPTKSQVESKVPEPEEPIDDDFNIFADAGEYEGIDVGEDDEDDEENAPRVAREMEERDESSVVPQRWIPSNEPELPSIKPSIRPLSEVKAQSPPSLHKVVSEDEEEVDQPLRLVPLSSSALPSIKDFLAMDQAAGSHDKKNKRKNKKKAGTGDSDNDEGQKQKSVEAKVDRDYKRLKSYTDKKTAAGSK